MRAAVYTAATGGTVAAGTDELLRGLQDGPAQDGGGAGGAGGVEVGGDVLVHERCPRGDRVVVGHELGSLVLQDHGPGVAAAHQLQQLGEVQPGALGHHGRLGQRDDLRRAHQLVARLGHLARAQRPQVDGPPARREHLEGQGRRAILAAHHDGQLTPHRARLAPGHRGVHEGEVRVLAVPAGDVLRGHGGADRDDDAAALAVPLCRTVREVRQQRVDLGSARDHEEHEVRLACHVAGVVHGARTLGLVEAVVQHHHVVARGHQVRGHGGAHGAQADDAHGAGGGGHGCSCGRGRWRSIVTRAGGFPGGHAPTVR